MNFKKTGILAIILCFLILIFYLVESPLKNKKKEGVPLLVPGFEKEKAVSILIKSPTKGTIQLLRQENRWTVKKAEKSYMADTAPVKRLLDTVGSIKIETLASKNPKKHHVFEVTTKKGIEVIIKDEAQNVLAHFFVGKVGPDLFSTYLRKNESHQVVLTSGILKSVFDKELKDWRDKTIFSFNKDNIATYEVNGDRQFYLKKQEKQGWEMISPEKFQADKETVDNCLKTFATLKGVDFAEGTLKEFQLDNPVRKIIATLKDGETKTLLVGKEKNTYQHFVKSMDADTIFVLENYKLERLTPEIKKFKQKKEKKEKKKANEKTVSKPKDGEVSTKKVK